MPVVYLPCERPWLPDDEEPPELPEPADPTWTTWKLITATPDIVAKAVSEVDLKAYKPTDVVVYVVRLHRWSQNTNNMTWDIQPGKGDLSWAESQERRVAVRHRVYAGIEKELEQLGTRPSFDVDIRPIDGTGISISATGEKIAEWGGPRSS